ncbi:hypothetical protein [Amycolatopsis cihanbeyliensis]|uniref:Uncharacterized protein n=1 Tax=Amycolatopsis cihanbeyliensis TaxID=1128664 RepID=A0A542DIZ7_AMYCI|nr:hypothetical protein [Amycolatopsis cihanbeyliensis]TQJ03077.1 hypothetical protein FB471_2827 [Amycolatopsis cihanbeyliensis]
MDESWFRLVSDGVWRYLDEVVAHAKGERGTLAREAGRTAAAWRTLLRLHGGAGHCRRCRRRGLCLVWQVAIGYFIRRLPGQ